KAIDENLTMRQGWEDEYGVTLEIQPEHYEPYSYDEYVQQQALVDDGATDPIGTVLYWGDATLTVTESGVVFEGADGNTFVLAPGISLMDQVNNDPALAAEFVANMNWNLQDAGWGADKPGVFNTMIRDFHDYFDITTPGIWRDKFGGAIIRGLD